MSNGIPAPKEYEPPPEQFPLPVDFTDFEVLPVIKPKPIIKSLFDLDSRMIFGGGSKTFKSWAMCDLALSLASETPWLGFETFLTRSLYVNFELKEYYFQKRLNTIKHAKSINVPKGIFSVWNLRGFPIKLKAFIDELSAVIERQKREVVFIDPFYKLLGDKDERLSSELNPILIALGDINRRTGASVIAAAHYTKGNQAGKEPMDRISGGGSLNRDPDCLTTFTNHENPLEFTLDFTVRDFPPIDSFVVKWVHPLLVRTASDPTKIKRPARGPVGYDPQALWTLISDYDNELSTAQLVKKAKEEIGWSDRTTYAKLAVLRKQKQVYLSKLTGNWNVKI